MAKLNVNSSTAIAEIRKLITEVESLKKSLGSVNSTNAASFNKLETGLKKLNSAAALSVNKFKYLEAVITKQNSTIAALVTKTNKATSATNKNTTATNKNTTAKKKGTSANSSMNLSMGKLIKSFGIIGGIRVFAKLAYDSFELIKTFDGLGFAMERITKNSFDLAESNIFLDTITEDYGVTLVATTERWIKFLAAAKQSGITLLDTQKIFGTMTKAAGVLGLKTDELRSIYLALEQMLSKGKVTTEELRRQLGERLPGAMGIMAASMGVTISQLDKMMKKGEVLSAEVLPGFADAVEIAFGLQTIDTIDTLIARQNRMKAAWQGFIKSVAEGDGVIKYVLGGMFDLLGRTIERLDWLMMTSNQKRAIEVGKLTKTLEKDMENQSVAILNAKAKEGKKYSDLVDKVQAYEQNKVNATTKAALKIVEENYAKDMAALIAFNDAKKALMNEHASSSLTAAKKTYDEDMAMIEAIQFTIEENGKKNTHLRGQERKDALATHRKNLARLKEYQALSIESEAKLMLFRKFSEDSKVSKFIEEDDDGSGSGVKSRKVDTTDLDRRIQRAKELQDIQQDIVNNNDRAFEDQKDAADQVYLKTQQIVKLEKDKAKLIYENTLFNIKQSKDSLENKQINVDIANGKYLNSIEKLNFAEEKAYEKLIETKIKLSNNFVKNKADEIKADIERQANIDIAAVKAKYTLLGELTKKEEKDLNKEVAEIKRIANNKALLEMADFIEEQIKLLGIGGEALKDFLRKIDEFRAGIKLGTKDNEEEEWVKIVKFAEEAAREMADIADGLFAKKIENINAEINAVKEKYDLELKLAGDDAEHKLALEQQRDAKIKILEAKRLKEEQKQARVRKAFALADIATNTAVAISKVLGQTGIFGLAAWIPVAALGALQAAAVLAQPIPQYKHGIDNVKEAHIGMINDGGKQEYINRGGNILTTKTKNAIVGLQPGDTVYKSYDDMNKKIMMMSIRSNGDELTEDKFNKLGQLIEGSFEKGFNKVKINNVIRLINNQNNNDYKNSLNRWSK